ncbi:MAG: hypothetical protein KJZ84_03220 [Bryobacteraceae bacterium]|nr:hypothetical protein [Bryobacteraceae bacterium]
MSEPGATALTFSLLALVLLWFVVFELLPDLWSDYVASRRHQAPALGNNKSE